MSSGNYVLVVFFIKYTAEYIPAIFLHL